MGLDIYLYKANVASEQWHEIEAKEQAHFLHFFGNQLVDVEQAYIDWAKTFAQKGLKEREYVWFMTDSDGYYFRSLHGSDSEEDVRKNALMFRDEDLVEYTQKDKALPVEKIGYQRKGISGFGEAFGDRCEDGTLTLFTKEEVLRLVPYVDQDRKELFQQVFLEPFVDGETFLWLWW